MYTKEGLQEEFAVFKTELQYSSAFCNEFSLDIVTFEHYVWAYLILDMSRVKHSNAIIPLPLFLDLHPIIPQQNEKNHASSFPIRKIECYFDPKLQTYHVTAITPFAAGEKLVSTIDLLCMKNVDLITRFGTCITPNPNDYFAFTIDLDDVQQDAAKTKLLKYCQVDSLHFLHPKLLMHEKLRTTFRICFMNEDEVHKYFEKFMAEEKEHNMKNRLILEPIEDEATVKETMLEILNSLIEPEPEEQIANTSQIELLLSFKKQQFKLLQEAIKKL